ncbi:helix-turn-helix transcriptional regulator [Dactylosporangium vinaceum]|uniref:ArsR/SmtB family transcription factor n=1 Tax=Dactylosporangium vinaceum TaxID=53362 RepID=A0ABV5M9P6_9ACTN|nr:helix-turn-helix domain-containing protein [Dactylosporangium vinaceum]UAC00066.1 helix-turn-helix transcriptional regulator [Dactylosporangium vinaceum]
MRPLPPVPERLDLIAVLNCLADPVRLAIVDQLDIADDLECGTFDVPVTKSTLTHHFRVLRESGVIATTRIGTRSLNRLRRAALEEAFPGLLSAVLTARRGQHQLPARA